MDDSALDINFCSSQSFYKEKKLEILIECNFPWNNTERGMQMNCPLDTR